jgi:hypothetical protein
MKRTVLLSIVVLLGSCFPQKSFVASSFEPIVVEKKNEYQISGGLRPIGYWYSDFTYGLSDKIALKLNAAGFIGLGNFSASSVYYKRKNNSFFYAGPLFNFQSNQIKRNFGNISGTALRSCSYNCIYYSPGLVAGAVINKGKEIEHHFILKGQYNIVDTYQYSHSIESREEAFDSEYFVYRIPNFLSFEPSYAILVDNGTHKSHIKIQFGYILTEKTYRHDFDMQGRTYYGYPYNKPGQTRQHPVNWTVNFSIGYIFHSKRSAI